MSSENRAILYKIETKNGQSFGVCNHDQDIILDGITYQARGALRPSEIESEIGISIQNMEILGGVSDGIIGMSDLKHGKLLGAKVTQFEYDFLSETVGCELFYGVVSELEYSDDHFRAVLSAPLEALNLVFGRSYIRSCQAILGDAECGVDLQRLKRQFVVEKLDKITILISGNGNGFLFKGGYFHSPSGEANPDRVEVLGAQQNGAYYELSVRRDRTFDFKEGDKITLYPGCDKSIECCKNLFDNVINFRGFPHMPGEEILNANAEKHIGKS